MVRRAFISALVLASFMLAGCGQTQTYRRRVALDRPVVSEVGRVAWFIEVWDDVEETARSVRVRQRTTVVVCHVDRTPPCIRVTPAEEPEALRRWVGSEPNAPAGDLAR